MLLVLFLIQLDAFLCDFGETDHKPFPIICRHAPIVTFQLVVRLFSIFIRMVVPDFPLRIQK